MIKQNIVAANKKKRLGDAELLSANHLIGRIKTVKSGHEVPEYWKRIILYNGEIECRLLEYELYSGSQKSIQEATEP